MAGRVVRVCPPRDFDFSDVTDQSSDTVIVEERIDAAMYDIIDVCVRVHQDSTLSTNGAIAVELVSDGYTPDDPSVEFFGDVLDSQNVVTLSGAISAGDYALQSITSGIGSMVAVRVKGTGGTGSVQARLSIDLAMKTS